MHREPIGCATFYDTPIAHATRQLTWCDLSPKIQLCPHAWVFLSLTPTGGRVSVVLVDLQHRSRGLLIMWMLPIVHLRGSLKSDRWCPCIAIHLNGGMGPFANKHAAVGCSFVAQTQRFAVVCIELLFRVLIHVGAACTTHACVSALQWCVRALHCVWTWAPTGTVQQ